MVEIGKPIRITEEPPISVPQPMPVPSREPVPA